MTRVSSGSPRWCSTSRSARLRARSYAVRRSVGRLPQNADESLAAVARAIVAVRRGIDLTDEIRLD